MADAAFKTAPYPGYTTVELQARLDNVDMPLAATTRVLMLTEIERRAARDAGDTSVMTPGERLRHVRNGGTI